MIPIIQLDGQTNVDLGFIVVLGSRRPILPGTVDRTLAIPGRHGLWDFGADLGAKLFEFTCAINQSSTTTLQQSVATLAAFLLDSFGRPRTIDLVFLTDPDKSFKVRLMGELPIDRMNGYGSFTLPLIAADPFARSITGTDGIILNSDILLDSDFRLDDVWSFVISAVGSHEVSNWGTLIIYPEIVITGSFTTLSIVANGKTFGYTAAISNKTLVVDGERMTVKLDGANALSNMTGDFIELEPGINDVTIGGTGLSCTVSINFKPRFV